MERDRYLRVPQQLTDDLGVHTLAQEQGSSRWAPLYNNMRLYLFIAVVNRFALAITKNLL